MACNNQKFTIIVLLFNVLSGMSSEFYGVPCPGEVLLHVRWHMVIYVGDIPKGHQMLQLGPPEAPGLHFQPSDAPGVHFGVPGLPMSSLHMSSLSRLLKNVTTIESEIVTEFVAELDRTC